MGSVAYYLKAYAPFITRYCQNLEKFGIGVDDFYLKYGWEDDDETDPDSYIPDAVDDEFQTGDDDISSELGPELLRDLRAAREKNRSMKHAKHLLELQNGLALQQLKPLIDTISPKMRKLQTLEVKRGYLPSWKNLPTKYFKHPFIVIGGEVPYYLLRTWYPFIDSWGRATDTYIDMDLADDAKRALAFAVLKRSKEMEAAKQLRLSQEETPAQTNNSFVSQLDLPNVRPEWRPRGGFSARGRGQRGGWRGRGGSYYSQSQNPNVEVGVDGAAVSDDNRGGILSRGHGDRGRGGRCYWVRGRGGRGRGRGRGGNTNTGTAGNLAGQEN